jgi:signal transduction histidine kinase
MLAPCPLLRRVGRLGCRVRPTCAGWVEAGSNRSPAGGRPFIVETRTGRFSVSIQTAVLALVAVALLAAVVPAGLFLDRWLARELEARAWRDVALAPAILADRNVAIGDALMMHAKEVAHSPELVAALVGRDPERAMRVVQDAARALNHMPLLVGPDGAVWDGPAPPSELVQATREGKMPVAVVADSARLYLVSIAPVEHSGGWLGAAGVADALDAAAAEALAGLTRSDLVLLLSAGSPPVASAELPFANEIARSIESTAEAQEPRELRAHGERYLIATGPLGGATVVFVRDLRRDMSILPRLQRVLLASGTAALAVALLLGALLALVLVRPVRALASAADRLSHGDFEAPLAVTPVREVKRVTQAFDAMRTSLAGRIEELRAANRMLEERQARLTALQSELIRRERVAVSGRMAVELAHEIRNPVANLRNCLELLHRRLQGDAQGQEYASLAIDELLRMHELAERALDLHRPRDEGPDHCDAAEVAREVAALARLGEEDAVSVTVRARGNTLAAIPPDALKQVLLNLVQNARETVSSGLTVEIDVAGDDVNTKIAVSDNGPGVPPEIRARIFDPFFTTRATAGGRGLGLFVVEGVIRGHGGRVWVTDRTEGRGACFHIVAPAFSGGAIGTRQPVAATAEVVP